MKARWLIWVLWPAFVGAAMAFVLVFSLIDPRDLRIFGRPLELSHGAVYTLGFGLAWAVCAVEPDEIDRINILQASLLAMARALEGLGVPPSAVLVDGKQVPPGDWPARAIIGGDAIEPAIMAASILAKVHRDQLMRDLDTQHPGYGFALHKGYPTAAHRDALRALGACPVHRRSYAPVRRCLAEAAG